MASAAQPTCFLIADISGYTGYLADVELDHAQDILADLIGAVVTALRPTSGSPSSKATPRSRSWPPKHSTARCSWTRSSAAISGFAAAAATFARPPHASATHARESRTSTSSSSSTTEATIQQGGRPPGAARLGRGRRPPTAEERGRREAGYRRVCAPEPGLYRRVRHRPGRARHGRASPRPTSGSATSPAGRTTSSRRWQEEEARGHEFGWRGSVPSSRFGADQGAAPGGMGVPHQAGPADDLAAVGDRGHDQGRHRGPTRTWLGEPLHARQGCRHRGNPRLAAVRLRHRPDHPCHARRAAEGAAHDRAGADADGHHGPHAVRRADDASGDATDGGDRTGLRAGPRGVLPGLVAQLDAEFAAREAERGVEPELNTPSPDGPLAGLPPLAMVG